MNFKRICRALICLIVVFALLVNISPIRAKAFAAESFLLPAIGIIASILILLGIDATYDFLMNSEWANQCVDYLRSLGYDITNGMIRLYALGEGLYGVQEQLVQDVFDALYLSGAVYMEPAESYDANTAIRVNAYNNFTQHVTSTQPFIVYGVLYPYGTTSRLATFLITAAAATFTITGDMYSSSGSKKTTSKLTDGFYYYQLMTSSDIRDLSLIHIPYATAESGDVSVLLGGIEEISKSDIFELENVAPQGTSVAQGYPEWAANAVALPNEGTGIAERYYPIDVEIVQDPTDNPGFDSDGTGLPEGIGATLATIITLLTGMKVSLDFIPNVVDGILNLPAKLWSLAPSWLTEGFQSIAANLLSIAETIVSLPQHFDDVLSAVQAIPGILSDLVISGIQAIFIPSADYVTAKVEALAVEYAFAAAIIETGKAISTGLTGISTEPPVIYVDLGAASGSHNYGGRVAFLDLRWYSEYKATVDVIISAFLWICFIWRMLMKLPGIISGMPGDFVLGSAHALGLDAHLPTRNAAYELQRISNRELIRKGAGK